MRLIDADELLTHIEDYGDGQYCLDLISPYYVHNATTIDAIPIPKGATNGDILEMIFPQMKVEKMGTLVELEENGVPKIGLNDDFWDAPYKRGKADEY